MLHRYIDITTEEKLVDDQFYELTKTPEKREHIFTVLSIPLKHVLIIIHINICRFYLLNTECQLPFC